MADDLVTIYNQALSAIGLRSSVSSPTEASLEREVLELWYTTVRDQVLRAAPWPRAEGYRRLGLLSERDFDSQWVAGDPSPSKRYAYAIPSDMIWPRFLSNYSSFSMGLAGDKSAIFTDSAKPILTYTVRLENIAQWDSGMRMAVVYGLGAAICTKLTGKRSLAADTEVRANDIIIQAREQSANSEVETYESLPEWFQARGFALGTPSTRFIYENGSLLQNVGVIGAR